MASCELPKLLLRIFLFLGLDLNSMALCEREGECLNELSRFESIFLCYLEWFVWSIGFVRRVKAIGSFEETYRYVAGCISIILRILEGFFLAIRKFFIGFNIIIVNLIFTKIKSSLRNENMIRKMLYLTESDLNWNISFTKRNVAHEYTS
jgi:hypothetical protein